MTTEEIIKTIEIALAEVESDYPEWEYPMDYAGAFKEAISALLAKAETEKKTALTLEELRELDGEPVWVVLRGEDIVPVQGYGIVDTELECVFGIRFVLRFDDYNAWLVYRRKPEE